MQDDTCVNEGCDKPIHVKARKLCRACYEVAWKAGFTDRVPKGRTPSERGCDKDGCTRKHKALGLCRLHLDQERAAGNLLDEDLACTFAGCTRPRSAEELCLGHVRQKRKGKELTPLKQYVKRDGTCPGPECSEPIHSGGYCSGHYWQASEGRELTPIVREPSLKGQPCIGKECTRKALTRDGLCRTHYQYRLTDVATWDRPIPRKAPNGAGHLNVDGYRVITVNGRNMMEHRYLAEKGLKRPLYEHEEVHHRNGNRSDNRTKGLFVMDDRGRLRSGNLEIWSTSQPAGQEIGPKLDWAMEMMEEYEPYLMDEYLARMAAILERRQEEVAVYGEVDEREKYASLRPESLEVA